MMRWALATALAFTMLWATARAQSSGSSPPAFRVIVNPKNPQTSVGRTFLAEAFLKKTTTWPNGNQIHPVDQREDAPVRAKFSKQILGRTVASVRSYWQQKIFSGRGVPPPELDSDEAVIKYVLKYQGAIGYVSGTAEIGDARVVIAE